LFVSILLSLASPIHGVVHIFNLSLNDRLVLLQPVVVQIRLLTSIALVSSELVSLGFLLAQLVELIAHFRDGVVVLFAQNIQIGFVLE